MAFGAPHALGMRPQKTTRGPRPTLRPKATINPPKSKQNNKGAPAPSAKPMATAWGQGAPAASPAAPAPTTAVAPDALYNARVDLATKKGEQALSGLEGQEKAVKHDFGIDDPTNPFSRAEGLKRAYLARQKGTSAGLAAQGQLYSGAHERAMNRVRFDNERDYAALRGAYESALGQLNSSKEGAKTMTEEEKTNAFEAWLSRASAMQPDLPEEAAAPAEHTVAPDNSMFNARAQGDVAKPPTATPASAGLPNLAKPAPSGSKRGLASHGNFGAGSKGPKGKLRPKAKIPLKPRGRR